MKLKYKTRKNLSKIISILLVCLVGFGAVMGVSALSKKLNEESHVIHPSFEVGGLNANGLYKDTDASIYTKESFECLGLEIKLDFDSNVQYQVYFYDELDKFVSYSSIYDESMKLTVPANAKLARLVVTPIWADDVDKEDRVCHWYNVFKYANQLEISVLKEQEKASIESVAVFAIDAIDFDNVTDLKGYTQTSNPFMFGDNSKLFGKTITKIGVPIYSITDYSQESTFTVYVVNGVGTEATIVDTVELVLPANTYARNSIMDWHYFDVNIELGDNETLAFYSDTDTLHPMYSAVTIEEFGRFYTNIDNGSTASLVSAGSIFYDIWVVEE